MTSHRAEKFGMWSLILFIVRIFEYHEEDLTDALSLVCDNESLVNTDNKRTKLKHKEFPNETLEADWDVINEIVMLVKRYDQSIVLIKGHQDEKKKREELSLKAQLNCEADELAEEVQLTREMEPMQRKMTHHPNNPIQVHAKNVTIASRVKRNLRRLAKAPKLIEHIEKKADWPKGVFHTIDWEAHRTSISNIDLPNRFITKFVHNMLPTGNIVHLYKTYYDHRCPSCFAEQEDIRHLLTCPDPK